MHTNRGRAKLGEREPYHVENQDNDMYKFAVQVEHPKWNFFAKTEFLDE